MVQAYKPLYSVKEVSQVLGTNTNYVYELIKEKQLPCLLINNRKSVRGTDLERFIEKLPTIN